MIIASANLNFCYPLIQQCCLQHVILQTRMSRTVQKQPCKLWMPVWYIRIPVMPLTPVTIYCIDQWQLTWRANQSLWKVEFLFSWCGLYRYRADRHRGSTEWFTGVTSVCPGRLHGCPPRWLAATEPPHSETVHSDALYGPVAAPSADVFVGLSAGVYAALIVSERKYGRETSLNNMTE